MLKILIMSLLHVWIRYFDNFILVIKVKEGQHVNEGFVLAQVGNSGSSSEPHLHIHHQRENPSEVSMFYTEGLPLYFRTKKGALMPERGTYVKGN